MAYFNAFWVGGTFCLLAQILIDKTKLTPARILTGSSYHDISVQKTGRTW